MSAYAETTEVRKIGPASPGMSRRLVLASVPVILALSLVSGGVAFLAGQGLDKALERHPRKAHLPVAGDRVYTVSKTRLRPVVARAASPIQPLSAVTTDTAGNWVRIPSLDVAVPLARAKTMNDDDVLAALAHGVALYPNGITPGTAGNTFISGHSTGEPWKGLYRFAFIHLSKLRPGDVILVDDSGVRYTYRMTGNRTIDPRAVPSLESRGDTPTLTLMSCWPLWTTTRRLLIDATLIAVNPLTLENEQ